MPARIKPLTPDDWPPSHPVAPLPKTVILNFRRSEIHRASREKEAFMLQTLEAEPDQIWTELVPMLDEGMSRLRTSDRNAVVLRYFEN